MCHTNTRSRLRGRELNYGLDVEQFLNIIRGITTSTRYYTECWNARMLECTNYASSFFVLLLYTINKSSFQCKSSISYTAFIMLLPCNISNNLSSYHNTNYVIIVTVKYMFCKSYKKDQQIIIVDFICIGLIHCITKVF